MSPLGSGSLITVLLLPKFSTSYLGLAPLKELWIHHLELLITNYARLMDEGLTHLTVTILMAKIRIH